jgi:hypothetical protein
MSVRLSIYLPVYLSVWCLSSCICLYTAHPRTSRRCQKKEYRKWKNFKKNYRDWLDWISRPFLQEVRRLPCNGQILVHRVWAKLSRSLQCLSPWLQRPCGCWPVATDWSNLMCEIRFTVRVTVMITCTVRVTVMITCTVNLVPHIRFDQSVANISDYCMELGCICKRHLALRCAIITLLAPSGARVHSPCVTANS